MYFYKGRNEPNKNLPIILPCPESNIRDLTKDLIELERKPRLTDTFNKKKNITDQSIVKKQIEILRKQKQ